MVCRSDWKRQAIEETSNDGSKRAMSIENKGTHLKIVMSQGEVFSVYFENGSSLKVKAIAVVDGTFELRVECKNGLELEAMER